MMAWRAFNKARNHFKWLIVEQVMILASLGQNRITTHAHVRAQTQASMTCFSQTLEDDISLNIWSFSMVQSSDCRPWGDLSMAQIAMKMHEPIFHGPGSKLDVETCIISWSFFRFCTFFYLFGFRSYFLLVLHDFSASSITKRSQVCALWCIVLHS